MLLIGSHALALRLPKSTLTNQKLDYRVPKDIDIICTYEEFEELHKRVKFIHVEPFNKAKKIHAIDNMHKHYEFEIAWESSTALELIRLVNLDPNTKKHNIGINGWLEEFQVPCCDCLFALKSSHRFLKNSPHFLKTMHDYKLLKGFGSIINAHYADWHKKREKETYSYNHPKLNQKKMGFFDKSVKYVYDHDSIHMAVAYPLTPAYTLYQADNQEVLCSKEKFFALDEMTKLRGVLEECYVLALERSQIPFDNKPSPDWSFKKALEKVCTSITSGWFRSFAYDNYDKLISIYDKNYVDKFKRGIEMGIVRKL